MRCVALMRNVNQGQRGHPSTADVVGGFADAVLERLTGGRATSRGLPTLIRLVDRFGPADG